MFRICGLNPERLRRGALVKCGGPPGKLRGEGEDGTEALLRVAADAGVILAGNLPILRDGESGGNESSCQTGPAY